MDKPIYRNRLNHDNNFTGFVTLYHKIFIMKKLELSEMENLHGGSIFSCAMGIGFGFASAAVLGPWGFVIGMSIGCTQEAY